jgi:hypothetical protein
LKTLLNVGGHDKAIALPPQYAAYRHLLLDIDPKVSPDVLCDARNLKTLQAGQTDVVYCSHNLEHYYRHEVPNVLAGFLHVLKQDGFAHIRVPDIGQLMRFTVEKNLDVEDVLYQSPAGPITVLDVLYGYGPEIEQSGQDFFAHKTGFTEKSLAGALSRAGFPVVYIVPGALEITAYAFKDEPDAYALALLQLPAG